ncbi:hypothetical protein HA466_0151080 [Hirschfeldia incana]|nr:hypothetical protein HA466_0151080 [Hirschfeldia incana]
MDDSPEEVDGSFSAGEEEDLCRICRSPEEPGNPLIHPCSCRGSIKYVHQDCLLLWLNRRGYKQCEVCGRSYSYVPVYSDNAPERLPCNEFLIEVLLRAARYTKFILPWIAVILLNTYFFSFHPMALELAAARSQRSSDSSSMSGKLAYWYPGLFYTIIMVSFMTMTTLIRMEIGDLDVDVDVRRFGRVVEVLWKHMTILCVWYYRKLNNVLGQPRRQIVLPQNAEIHEFGVIRELLFFLDDDAFALLAISVYVSTLFLLLPVWIGWVVLAHVGGSFVSGNSPVLFGYMTLLSTCFAYFTLLLILFPAIVRWVSLGVHFIALKLPSLLWAFSVKSCKSLRRQTSFAALVQWFSLGCHFVAVTLPPLLWIFIKEASVLCIKIGVFPWMIGYWLDICTSPLFGTGFFQRFENLSELPSMTTLRWVAGTLWLLVAESFMKRIQEIVHKRGFWYLLDVTDPDYKITKMNCGHTLFALASHGVLLVIMFHLPIRAITLISPTFFPLELWVMDEKVSLRASFVYVRLLMKSPEWLIGLTKPAVELIVKNWMIIVSSWLELTDFLLVVPRREDFDQNVRPVMQPRSLLRFSSLAEGSMVTLHGSQNAEEDVTDQRDNRFLLRIVLMLVLAALSLFIVSTAFMALPILLGRVFLESISSIMLRYFGLKRDDLCAFWIGYNTWREILTCTCFVYDEIHKGRIDVFLRDVFEWIRNGLLFSIWITVIPGLLGVLIDLMIIIPTRVPLDESPVYFLIQDWLIGVVVLHIWGLLTMLTPINWFATEAWRRKFKRIRTVGIDRLPSMWLLREVIGSLLITLLITLSFPYLLVKSLFPLLGFQESVNSATERLIWPALFALVAVWFVGKLTREVIIYLHQLVFNERYMVGERLGNLAEEEDIEPRI